MPDATIYATRTQDFDFTESATDSHWTNALCIGNALIVFSLAWVLPAAAAEKSGFTFAGVPVTPGATVRANVPLNATEKSYAAEIGNPVPANAVALLAVPAGFDPRKSWPLLVVFSTSDLNRQNRTRPGRISIAPRRWPRVG